MTKNDSYAALTQWARETLSATNGKVPPGFGEAVFRQVLDEVFELLLKEGRINFPGGYGSLYLTTIPSRRQKDHTGKMVQLPEKKDIRFSAGQNLSQRLNATDDVEVPNPAPEFGAG